MKYNLLQVINEVKRKFALDPVNTLDDDHSRVLVTLVNQVIQEIADQGNWAELYRETTIPLVAGEKYYSLGASDDIKSIEDVRWEATNSRFSTRPLHAIMLPELRRWSQTNISSYPSYWTINGVDVHDNPQIMLYPTPSAEAIENYQLGVSYYVMPMHFSHYHMSEQLPFDGTLIVLGLTVKALDEEGNLTNSPRLQKAQLEFEAAKRRALARFTTQTGNYIKFSPRRW